MERAPAYLLDILEASKSALSYVQDAEDQEAVIKLIDSMISKTRCKGPSALSHKRPVNRRQG